MKTEKKYVVRPKAEDLGIVGEERSWQPGQVTASARKHELSEALSWLNYVATDRDHRRFVEDWIREFRGKTAKQDLALYAEVSDRYVLPTFCNLARVAVRGFELTDEEHARIWNHILDAAVKSNAGTVVVAAPEKAVPKIGVQERINLQVQEAVMEIEDTVSSMLRNPSNSGTDLNKIRAASKFSAVHYRRLAEMLRPMLREFTELREVRADKKTADDLASQLIEGYEFVSNRCLKNVLAFLDNLRGTSMRLADEKKVTRQRKKKPLDKAKLVKRFKYTPKLDELKIRSIDPVNCLNTSEVWTYDSRRRKLAVYRGEFSGGISVKGSSLVGYSENSSTQKTLRKPEKQLAEFLALNKNQLRKWFDGIKSVENRPNGRSNDKLLILRVLE